MLGDVQLIDMLLAASADVNGSWAQEGGASALQLTAARGHLGVVPRLLSLGAHVDARRAESFGRTALESAAERGRLDTVQFLLGVGAEAAGEWGRWQYLRAIGFAKENAHGSVECLLRDWREWDAEDKVCELYHDLLGCHFREAEAEEWTEGCSCCEEGDGGDCGGRLKAGTRT